MASLLDSVTVTRVFSLPITSSISPASKAPSVSARRISPVPEFRGLKASRRSLVSQSASHGTNLRSRFARGGRIVCEAQDTTAAAVEGGACGYDNPYHAGFGAHTAALSGALFRNGESCGGCYQVRCDYWADPKWCLRGAAVTVTATNFCPSNNNGGWCNLPRHHFDMSMPAFFRIARRGNEGIVPVFYRRVGCKRRGGVRFTMRGQGNFNMVILTNVGGSGAVKAVAVRGSRGKTWRQMTRNWGANWQSSGDLRGQRLSFRVTLLDRKTITFLNVVPSSWWFGQTFSGRGQFL